MGQKTLNWTSEEWKSVLWTDKSKFEIFAQTAECLWDAAKVNAWVLHVSFPLWNMEGAVLWSGDVLLVTKLVICIRFMVSWTNMVITAYYSGMPCHQGYVWLGGPLFSSRIMTPSTHRSCARTICCRKEMRVSSKSWLGLHSLQTSIP